MYSIHESHLEEHVREEHFQRKSFPLEVFPDELEVVASKMASSFNVSVDCVCAAMLGIASAAIGNSCRIEIKEGWEEPLFLWLMLIGASGSGKTPMLSKLCEPVISQESLAHEEHLRLRAVYQVALDDYERQKKSHKVGSVVGIRPEEPVKTHYYFTDTTSEAFFDAMVSSPRGILLFQDELSGFINSHDQYKKSGNDRQKYLELWSCKPVKIHRLSRKDVFIQNTGCSIVGGIQPMTIPLIFQGQSFADGFLPRFLVSRLEESSLMFSFQVLRPRDIKPWEDFIKYCYGFSLILGESGKVEYKKLIFSDEARGEFSRFHDELAFKRDGLSSWADVFIPKLVSYCARITGILHVMQRRKGRIVSKHTVSQAIEIVHYFAGETMSLISDYSKKKETLTRFERDCLRSVLNISFDQKSDKLSIEDITKNIGSCKFYMGK